MRRLLGILAATSAGLALGACGSSHGTGSASGGGSQSPSAPVRSYLKALDQLKVSGNVASPSAAERTCLTRHSGEAARSSCLAQVIQSRPSSAEPTFSAVQRQLCSSLSPAAGARFWQLLKPVAPSGNVALFEALAGGTHYPPSCLEALSDLQSVGAGLPGAMAVMDGPLAQSTHRYATLKLAVVSQSADHATVRVATSSTTVPVVKVAGAWKIAALAGT